MRQRSRRLGVIVCGCVALMAAPTAARAQLAPVGAPRGVVRLDVGGILESADRRFFDGRSESYAGVMARASLDGSALPELRPAEASIGRIVGDAGFRLSLGASSAEAELNRNVANIGLALGLPGRFTLFGRVPIVRVRVQSRFALDSIPGNVGVNTADPLLGTATGQQSAATFFGQFDAALSTLAERLAAGAYDADPTLRARAEATLAEAGALRDDLFAATSDPSTASPFLPTTSSAAGTAILARVAAVQGSLSGELGVPGFAATPVLPSQRASADEFENYLGNPAGPIAGVIGEYSLLRVGDSEVGLTWTAVDDWDRERLGGVRAAVTALVRLPTGYTDLTEHFLDIGTGDRQTDIAAGVALDVGRGLFGARVEGGYTRQLAATLPRRVAAPDEPFPARSRLAVVRRDPGDIVSVAVHPYVRLAPTLALQFGLVHRRRGEDVVSYATPDDVLPGVDAALLAAKTSTRQTVFSAGLSYYNPGAERAGGQGVPMAASWTYEKVIDGSGGAVPQWVGIRAEVRLFYRLFR